MSHLFQVRRSYEITRIDNAKTIVIFDSNNIGWRSWYASSVTLPVMSSASAGSEDRPVRTSHVYNFTRTYFSFLKKIKGPKTVVFAIDGYPKHKYAIHEGYKGNRGTPREGGDPMPDITELVSKLPGYTIFDKHQEADDVIASFIRRLRLRERRRGKSPSLVYIVSSDTDMYQLIRRNVLVWKSVSDTPITPDEVFRRMNVRPKHVALHKSIFEDVSDCIKGVPHLRRKPVVKVLARTDGTFEDLLIKAENRIGDSTFERLSNGRRVVTRNMSLVVLNKGLKIVPRFNSFDKGSLYSFLVDRFNCISLKEDINRLEVSR